MPSLTAEELIQKLKESGTGVSKIDALSAFVAGEPKATAQDVVDFVDREVHDTAATRVISKFGEGTLEKVRLFMEGKEPKNEVSRITQSSLALNDPRNLADQIAKGVAQAIVQTQQLGPQAPNVAQTPHVGPIHTGAAQGDKKK